MAELGFEPCLIAAQAFNLCFFIWEGRGFGLSLEDWRPVKWSKEGMLAPASCCPVVLQCGLNAGRSVVFGSRRWGVDDRAGASED